ncbi:ERF family protein [Acinetobacter bereziniae]|uniref:ERF family protein n=1 Tax=Acinetobacter bereziniae TaxID=106648 RepID=UPI0019013FB0|nr:ERF family protein [Acinetobacter bereziniae]MBJ8476601.1 ERF family protein [Acinetobacter bereziniae]
MNTAIDKNIFVKSNEENYLDLPGVTQVFHHPTFVKVINDLKAPKIHTNDFGGGYKYRSAEDIQEALKPILLKHKCSVIMRKFDIEDGFEIYAYIIFKDQTYIRCELPGVANYDFDRDLGNNKKISKTQQYAAYQSYAKKYALSNLLMIDDSQNDLDTFTNNNIQNEHRKGNKQNYQQQATNVPTQADCDRALKQIESLALTTPLHQAEYFFDGIRASLPEFEQVLYEACKNKYAAIQEYLESVQNNQQQQHQQKQTSTETSNIQTNSKSVESTNKSGHSQNIKNGSQTKHNTIVLISNQQLAHFQTFIDSRGLDNQIVCEHLGIDALNQIKAADLEAVKKEIDQLAKQEMKA